jgi:hypothetical protein
VHGRDVATCRPGVSVSLFPATVTFIDATVVDPAATFWDPLAGRYIVGPVTSRGFLQVAGRRPDFNANGFDDYLDILKGGTKDFNLDGVPDDFQVR